MVSSQRLRCVVQGLSGRLLLALLFCAYPWQASLALQRDDQHVLVLGRISDDPRQHHGQLKPLLDYVVPRMAGVGITEGRILMARDAQQMASYLRRGRVDWVTETSGAAVLLAERSGAEPLLLTERNGVAQYHTVFFARRDSTVSGLAQLRGKRLAVQGAMSTSAYMVPLTTLLANDVQPEILMGLDDVPAADRIGYVYARSERNIATWVQRGLVDVGAFSNIDWDNQAALPPGIRRELRIIHRTESYPRALELVRADLPVAVRERLREVLLQASRDPAAAPALRQFFGTSAFAPVDPGSQARLDVLRSGLRRVRMEVE